MGAPIGTLRIAHAVINIDTKTKIVPGVVEYNILGHNSTIFLIILHEKIRSRN